MAPRARLPSGTVTFLFTDIEGSTGLLKSLGRDRYETVLARHAELLRAAVTAHGGRVVDTQGDSLFCAFGSAGEAVSAAIEGQRGLAAHEWPEGARVRVRIGLHSGEPKAGTERYVGIGVHRAARIGAAAHGGQVLVSETTRGLVSDDLPAGVSLRDLGAHRLKDIDQPQRLYQVVATGLGERFPPPWTARDGRGRRGRVAAAATALAVAGGVVAAVLLLSRPAAAKPVRLVANSIAVVDPTTGKPVGDDQVWVLNGAAQTATAVDPGSLKVVETVGLDGYPYSQYATGHTDWVGLTGAVDEIASNGPDGADVTKIPLWNPPSDRAQMGQVCFVFVTGDGRTVWVAEGQHVAVIDAAGGNVLRTLELPAAPDTAPGATCYGLHYSDGRLLAIQNSSIGPVDLSARSFTPIITDQSLSALQYGSSNWASGFGADWVSSSTAALTNGVWNGGFVAYLERLDPVTGGITTRVRGGGSLAVDPATGVWSTSSNDSLIHVDAASGQITHTTQLGHALCCPYDEVGAAVAVGHGRVWVALDSP